MISEEMIKSILGAIFPNDSSIYQNAFIHKSALKNTTEYKESNERLEYLGDSVLNMIVGEYLYSNYKEEQEGFLTKQRTKLVCGKTLAKVALKYSFDRFIMMDERGMSNEWNKNTKVLEDAYEAFVGSIYLDQGLENTRKWVLESLKDEIENEGFLENTNYKEQVLQTYSDCTFKVSNELGKENEKLFVIQLMIKGKLISEGYGRSKKEAEQDASKKCLVCFQKVKCL